MTSDPDEGRTIAPTIHGQQSQNTERLRHVGMTFLEELDFAPQLERITLCGENLHGHPSKPNSIKSDSDSNHDSPRRNRPDRDHGVASRHSKLNDKGSEPSDQPRWWPREEEERLQQLFELRQIREQWEKVKERREKHRTAGKRNTRQWHMDHYILLQDDFKKSFLGRYNDTNNELDKALRDFRHRVISSDHPMRQQVQEQETRMHEYLEEALLGDGEEKLKLKGTDNEDDKNGATKVYDHLEPIIERVEAELIQRCRHFDRRQRSYNVHVPPEPDAPLPRIFDEMRRQSRRVLRVSRRLMTKENVAARTKEFLREKCPPTTTTATATATTTTTTIAKKEKEKEDEDDQDVRISLLADAYLEKIIDVVVTKVELEPLAKDDDGYRPLSKQPDDNESPPQPGRSSVNPRMSKKDADDGHRRVRVFIYSRSYKDDDDDDDDGKERRRRRHNRMTTKYMDWVCLDVLGKFSEILAQLCAQERRKTKEETLRRTYREIMTGSASAKKLQLESIPDLFQPGAVSLVLFKNASAAAAAADEKNENENGKPQRQQQQQQPVRIITKKSSPEDLEKVGWVREENLAIVPGPGPGPGLTTTTTTGYWRCVMAEKEPDKPDAVLKITIDDEVLGLFAKDDDGKTLLSNTRPRKYFRHEDGFLESWKYHRFL